MMFEVFKSTDLEMLFRLLIATVLGLMIGLERELKRKSLGLKTILVISIVSCLLTIVSIQSAYLFPGTENAEIRMDPMRLAAQIVSGVGFLGAGVILRRGDDTVTGLTTAALVWGAAGIGIATGAGFYVEATAGVIFLLISVKVIPLVIDRIGVRKLHIKELYLRIKVGDREDITDIIKDIEKRVIHVDNIRIKDNPDGSHLVVLLIIVDDGVEPSEVYNDVAEIEKIATIEVRA